MVGVVYGEKESGLGVAGHEAAAGDARFCEANGASKGRSEAGEVLVESVDEWSDVGECSVAPQRVSHHESHAFRFGCGEHDHCEVVGLFRKLRDR